ncbi:hypothetical protein PHIN6_03230 [Polynucleobacter sp. HIN6]|uniref:beta strand repeat-containing protein n=1 Tax=Polynucleobacter sp. HIN6 TaxID=3047865 RepID=UPI002572BED8|nr:autotransporter outer membrane beta-barrel domain-containing protein [Polynucleobacter sp. HIN6]BEI34805.1 hypothetical protein PHIN6_03230 [Polynucleobacter sp. HIN6]
MLKILKIRTILGVWGLSLFSLGVSAQSSPPVCSTTTTITSNSGPITLGTDGECLQINSGVTVTGSFAAVSNPSVQDVQITNQGTINGSTGISANAGASIYSLTNSNTINSTSSGVYNGGTISNLTNNSGATLSGSFAGIYLDGGMIGTLTNNNGATISGGVGIFVYRASSRITTLINSGVISSSTGSFSGIQNEATISSLENRSDGSITGHAGIYNFGTSSVITTLTNSGNITGNSSQGIQNEGTIGSLVNYSGSAITGAGTAIYNAGVTSSISSISNSGSITSNFFGIDNDGTIDAVTNNTSALIAAGEVGILNRSTAAIGTINNLGLVGAIDSAIRNAGSIASLTNSGTMSGVNWHAIVNEGSIGAITNTSSGTIAGGSYGIGNINISSTIESITNTGSIIGLAGGGIYNFGSISTLNNLQGQGNANGALIYDGQLPGSYNVIINSPTQYGQLMGSVVGATTFGIYTGSTVTRGTYSAVLSGFSSSNLNNTSGTFNGFRWSLSNSSADIWDLIVTGASTADTQQSLVNTASVLQGTYTLQNSVMVNGFTYDCSLFDKRGICISAGGRNTTVQAQGINNTSGLLIASYRLSKNNSRIGAWVDQNLSVSAPGTVKLGNSTPMIGLFGVWSQRPDGAGAEVKVSAAYGQKDTTITRQIVGTSEAGTGSSQLISQGAQVVAKYGFAVMPAVVISPYAGVRYTQNNMGGYTEATSSSVTAPLTYSALNTNATTALAGVGARYQGIPKTTLFASAGVETDTNTSNGSYSATGVDGLTPVNFNPNPVKTRPTATVGGYYDILKNQRIGITGIYRQEPFQAVSTTTVLATYTIGF